MNESAELEIGLHRWDAGNYAVDLRFTQPHSDADVRLAPDSPPLAHFDVDELRKQEDDTAAYGRALGASLLSDHTVHDGFVKAQAVAQALNIPLRIRLLIGPSAPELHGLRWEMMQDPADGTPLITGEQILFSRYLSSLDWRPVRLRPRGDLRALVVAANPSGLDQYGLAPLDVEAELERARMALGTIPVTALASAGSASLSEIVQQLRDGYDILYVLCHGAFVNGEPWLWLEDDAGNVARVAGAELTTRFRELDLRPRLVMLASCQSAGTGDEARGSDGRALAALGPRLAEIGIPAVVAVQGSITMGTMAQFMQVFFQEIQRDGLIDRAMAVARGAVRERPDAWMPVLFMRLRSGRIWYVPGFAEDQQAFEKWPALLRSIRGPRGMATGGPRSTCTPILGPGLLEPLVGSTRDIAQRWANQYHYPMALDEREDLAHVAQYLSVNQDENFPRDELAEYLRQYLHMRYADALQDQPADASLDDLVKIVGKRRQEQDPTEPHRVLAQLPFPIYITTNPDNLLAQALRDAGKDPQIQICPWNESIEQAQSTVAEVDPAYGWTAERPLVYHLFGNFQVPESVVLTEDNYFDYLIGVTSNKDLIPAAVRRAFSDTALLFLGFQMDDWDFRVLFRSIMGREGQVRLSRYAHVGVQIDPEEARILELDRARRYLESYFGHARISIYWGSVDTFTRDLLARWAAAQPAQTQPALQGAR